MTNKEADCAFFRLLVDMPRVEGHVNEFGK